MSVDGNPAIQASVLLRENDNSGVTTLTLNRPDAFNTLSVELLQTLLETLSDIAEDQSVKIVVLTGAGRAFCGGHDLNEMIADPGESAMQSLFALCSQVMMRLSSLPQPVIARVQGVAAAAGCQLVAQCDLAIAADTAGFATSGVKLGLFCSTPAVPLTRNIPRKQAFEMLMTGDMVKAHTAEQWGLINRAVPEPELDAAVADLVARIIDKSPAAIRRGKSTFYAQIDTSLQQAYETTTESIVCNMQDEDAQAGIRAFLDKAAMPEWQGR